ncbi:MAG: hypothetical protein QOJ93_493 [Actinomycetota bacterium]|nr:hypothetical protein [Actinomycetota bacterium]
MGRLRLLAVVMAVVLTGVLVFEVRRGSASRIGSAQRLLQHDARFANGPKAGTTFSQASNLLLQDAKSCARRHSARDERCAARFSAAAYTSVTAFTLIGCTQPGVYQARRDVLIELDGIVAVDRARGRAARPKVPDVPRC